MTLAAGIGSVLYQLSDDNECPIAFLSQNLNKTRCNYSTTEVECLAAVMSVKKFVAFIERHAFTVITEANVE